jgi:hypothetical protein
MRVKKKGFVLLCWKTLFLSFNFLSPLPYSYSSVLSSFWYSFGGLGLIRYPLPAV